MKQPQTLQILNDLLQIWIEQWYHKRPHDSLKGITPETAFKSDKRPLQFADPKLLADAFRYTKPAKVDKTGCLKFSGYVYEAGTAFIGRTVEILYNPESIEKIEVRCRGIAPVTAKKLKIGSYCQKRAAVPEKSILPADTSRLLDAAGKKHKERQQARHTAISFLHLTGGDNHVF